MGKLHTLRRAIKRNPEQYTWKDWRSNLRARSAYFHKGQWHPGRWISSTSYRSFVYEVLVSLGYKMAN